MSFEQFRQFVEAKGRKVELARAVGTTKQSVSDWLRNERVSKNFAAKVSTVTGIPKHVLCPDFDWGDAPDLKQPKRKAVA